MSRDDRAVRWARFRFATGPKRPQTDFEPVGREFKSLRARSARGALRAPRDFKFHISGFKGRAAQAAGAWRAGRMAAEQPRGRSSRSGPLITGWRQGPRGRLSRFENRSNRPGVPSCTYAVAPGRVSDRNRHGSIGAVLPA